MERVDEIGALLAGISDPVRLLRGIFTYAPFGLQVYRADGHCLLTNKAFRDLFGSEPPPEYNVFRDDVAERLGLQGLIRRAFNGETIQSPTFWYDPRELQQLRVTEGRRVAISITMVPMFELSGAVEHVAMVIKDQTEETLARERAEAAQAVAEGLAAQRAEQERWLQTVLDQMPTPLVFVEPGTARIFFANAAADQIAGGKLERPTSVEDYLRLFDVRDLEDRPLRVDERPTVRAARGEPISGAQVRWYTRNGPKVVTVHAARVPAMFGHAETVLIAFDDITRLKQVQDQLEDAVRIRQDFLTIAGHELRTPLTSVLLNVYAADKLLQDGPLATAPRLADRWQALVRQLGRLEGLVDQLLDVSRITAGKMVLAPESLELVKVVREVVARFSAAGEAGAIEVRADTEVAGIWDRMRLDQILTNLLSNALKYGGGKSISVDVRAADAGWARIAVRDRGIGIPPDEIGRIFDRFERAVSDRNYGGLGLGLWIVRQIVEAMGGSIAVESVPGCGSTFTVRLPCGPAA